MYIQSEKYSGKKLEILTNLSIGILIFILGGIFGLMIGYEVIKDYLEITQ